MGKRNRKRKSRFSSANCFRFELLESRLPFAVDYPSLAYDGGIAELQMDLAPTDVANDWFENGQAEMEFGTTPLYDLDSIYNLDPLFDFDTPAMISDVSPVVAEPWGQVLVASTSVNNSTSIAGIEAVPIELPGFGQFSSTNYPLASDILDDAIGLPVYGYAIATPFTTLAQDLDTFIDPDYLTIDDVWIGPTESFNYETFINGTAVRGQWIYVTATSPTSLLRSGPAEGRSDPFAGVTITTAPTSASLTGSPRSQDSAEVASTLFGFANFGLVSPSPSIHFTFRSPGIQSQSGVEANASGTFDFQFSSTHLASADDGLISHSQQTIANYHLLESLSNHSPSDAEFGTQLPVEKGDAANWHRRKHRYEPTQYNLIVTNDRNADGASVGLPVSVLPIGMLPIGGEPGKETLQVGRSYVHEEHFVVQTMLICENLPEADFRKDDIDSGTIEREISDSVIPNRSIGLIAIGCVIAVVQTSLRPSKYFHLKRWRVVGHLMTLIRKSGFTLK